MTPCSRGCSTGQGWTSCRGATRRIRCWPGRSPGPLASQVTKSLTIPTIGIGAGPACDGQVLVLHDMLGLNDRFSAKFVKRYAALSAEVREAVQLYAAEVREGRYPGPEHSFAK